MKDNTLRDTKCKDLVLNMLLKFGISMYRKIQEFIIYLLLGLLLSIVVSSSFGQQNQNTLQQEVEALQKRVSELEDKLQTVENVEKMELATKLAEAEAKHAEAYAKLIDTEFDKLKLELKDSNEKWLITWILIILGFLSVVGIALWSRLTKKMDDLIATEVEKRINRFQETVEQVDTLTNELNEAVGQVKIQQDRIRIIEREHAATVLEDVIYYPSSVQYPYPARINALIDTALLDVFNDEAQRLVCRCKAVEVLVDRKSTQIVSPVLEFLDSTLDSDTYKEAGRTTKVALRSLVHSLGMIHKQETYDGLTKFLNRLLKENTEMKDVFLTWTVFSLAYVGNALDIGSSISKMKEAIPYLEIYWPEKQALENMARYFDKFNDPDGIKEILANFGSTISEIKEVCLNLLEKYYPDFVKEQREEKATANTESEESDESKPTT